MITILFDMNCKLCHKTVAFLSDRSKVPVNSIPVGHLDSKLISNFGLSLIDIGEAMWLIDDKKIKFKGYWAFKEFFCKYSSLKSLGYIFSTKLSDYFGPKIYSFVSKNRHHLGCQSNNCQMR